MALLLSFCHFHSICDRLRMSSRILPVQAQRVARALSRDQKRKQQLKAAGFAYSYDVLSAQPLKKASPSVAAVETPANVTPAENPAKKQRTQKRSQETLPSSVPQGTAAKKTNKRKVAALDVAV